MISLVHDDFGSMAKYETDRAHEVRQRTRDYTDDRSPWRFRMLFVRRVKSVAPAEITASPVVAASPVGAASPVVTVVPTSDLVPSATVTVTAPHLGRIRRRRVSTSMVPEPSIVEYEHGSPVAGASGLTLERSAVVYGRHPRVEVTLSRSGVFAPVAGRPVELVLVAGGHDQHLRIRTHLDRWPPDGKVTVKRTVRRVRAGVYSAYLEVPATHTLPAMRLANVGTWDDTAQRNGLHQAVVVQPFAPRIRTRLHLPMPEVVRQPERSGSSRS